MGGICEPAWKITWKISKGKNGNKTKCLGLQQRRKSKLGVSTRCYQDLSKRDKVWEELEKKLQQFVVVYDSVCVIKYMSNLMSYPSLLDPCHTVWLEMNTHQLPKLLISHPSRWGMANVFISLQRDQINILQNWAQLIATLHNSPSISYDPATALIDTVDVQTQAAEYDNRLLGLAELDLTADVKLQSGVLRPTVHYSLQLTANSVTEFQTSKTCAQGAFKHFKCSEE